MEYYERERIIARCRAKLPYPISFYDRLSDGSLWNVYQKHVVNGIPIDKRGRKAKEENDKARAAEAQGKKAKAENDQARATEAQAKEEKWIPGDWQHNYLVANGFTSQEQPQEEYEQITLEEYMEAMQPQKPRIVRSNNGCWWRLNDAGEYDWIPDSELDDTLEAFGISTLSPEEEKGMQLVLRPNKRK